jgi:2-dehydro-3-deoxyphosphogluconate aldolase/(4S)-4-hydroxy-2-oxoglutarate aldolase
VTPDQVLEAVGGHRLVVIVRTPDPTASAGIARAAVDGGARVVEITADTPRAAGVIAELRAELPDDVVLGAGTVTRLEQADELIAAGAGFVVSPYLSAAVIRRAGELGVPAIPGAMTPAEIAACLEAGASMVKLFPAGTLGPGFLRAVRQVLPGLRALPTGGVDADNAGEWLDAGAFAIGVGGALTSAWRHGGAAAVRARAAGLVTSTRLQADQDASRPLSPPDRDSRAL